MTKFWLIAQAFGCSKSELGVLLCIHGLLSVNIICVRMIQNLRRPYRHNATSNIRHVRPIQTGTCAAISCFSQRGLGYCRNHLANHWSNKQIGRWVLLRDLEPHYLLHSTTVSNEPYPGKYLCSFSGVNKNFTYLFIPVLSFEALLFILAIRVSLGNMRNTKSGHGAPSLRVNSFMSILVRDSILYFFVSALSSPTSGIVY
jgi:hypothetical protein